MIKDEQEIKRLRECRGQRMGDGDKNRRETKIKNQKDRKK